MALPRTPNQKAATNRRTMTPLAAGGRSDLVTPEPRSLPTPPLYPQGTPIPWSGMTASIEPGRCPVHRIVEGGPLGVWRVTLEPASSGDVVIDAILDGSVVDTFTLTAGKTEDEWDMASIQSTVNQRLKISVTDAGPDDCDLTVHPDVF